MLKKKTAKGQLPSTEQMKAEMEKVMSKLDIALVEMCALVAAEGQIVDSKETESGTHFYIKMRNTDDPTTVLLSFSKPGETKVSQEDFKVGFQGPTRGYL